ncbi:MAG: hypothetical protein ACQ5SW_01025 [Sphaerochaetaceae bacterium]
MVGQFLYANDDSLLLALRIERASEEELKEMAQLRGIALDGEDSLRDALYAYYHLEHSRLEIEGKGERSYRLEIEQAQNMERNAGSSLVVLTGDVTVSFVDEGTQTPKKLKAQNMLIDLDHTLLTASGSVLFEDSEADAALQSIEGSIVTFDWSDDTLTISGGTTKSERENSEDETVSMYTSGSLITYQGTEGDIFYTDGLIGTKEEDPLSSIRAERLRFISGGDLMVHNAALYFGRVPVFWTPFFFFPGNRMVGNPSLGFVSDRGMFVSSTWEIYGSYPKFEEGEQSSITKLLSSPAPGAMIHGDGLYTTEASLSPLQEWARESDSYLTFFADAYETSGLHVGYDSKTTFFNKQITIDSLSAFALYPPGKTSLSLYSDVGQYRYYLDQGIFIDTSWAKLELSLPLYSDPKVRNLYGNRLTSFSFDALLGKSQEFPNTYRSDISNFTWKLKSSFTFPTTKTKPYLDSFSISNLEADAAFKWQDEGTSYAYLLQQLHLPLLSLTVRGTLLDYSSVRQEQDSKGETSAIEENLQDPLLPDAYQLNLPRRAIEMSAGERFISLSYSFDQRLTHTLNATLGVIDWDDAYLYSLSKGSLLLRGSPNAMLFSFSSELLPQFTFLEDQSKSTYRSESWQLFNINTITVPAFGLTYTLSQRIYRYQRNYTKPVGTEPEISTQTYAFDEDSVTMHQLRYQQSFMLGKGSITPSMTASLYPVKQRLLPGLKYEIGPFTFASSLLFQEESSVLRKDTLNTSVGYATKPLTITLSQAYDFTKTVTSWEQAMRLTGSSKEQFFSSFFTLEQRFSFQFYTSDARMHYFDYLAFDAAIPHLKITYALQGEAADLRAERLQVDLAGNDLQLRWWKKRIALTLGIDSSLKFFFQDRYASSFSIAASLRLQIAEFLDCTITAKSTNSGFSHYYTAQDTFSFALLWDDLLRSFDFFGDGRYNTQFNLSELSFTLVHDLEDWSLNCKYSGSVVLSNNQYSWVPTIAVYLTWNTIPELDVEETWTQNNTVWTRSSSS